VKPELTLLRAKSLVGRVRGIPDEAVVNALRQIHTLRTARSDTNHVERIACATHIEDTRSQDCPDRAFAMNQMRIRKLSCGGLLALSFAVAGCSVVRCPCECGESEMKCRPWPVPAWLARKPSPACCDQVSTQGSTQPLAARSVVVNESRCGSILITEDNDVVNRSLDVPTNSAVTDNTAPPVPVEPPALEVSSRRASSAVPAEPEAANTHVESAVPEPPNASFESAEPEVSAIPTLASDETAAETETAIVDLFPEIATPLESAPRPTTSDDACSSNTLILEFEAIEPMPDPLDPVETTPSEVDGSFPFSALIPKTNAVQASAVEVPPWENLDESKVLFAVPKLHPDNIPSTARIIGIDGKLQAQTNRLPYTLTVVPAWTGVPAIPIQPVLDGLRTGRRIEYDSSTEKFRR
jgi:hypothetical protein